uniref:Desmolaris n=1 Tax=Desmodus rotundus TaxID=9430 RepID=S5S4V7_DESRO|nr:desmolaris [Desmodus rotundus]
MNRKLIFWVSGCLLLTCASLPLNAEGDEADLNPEEDEHFNIPEKQDICFLEEDGGICRSYIPRYFYNSQSKQCEKFIYGGCMGNLNNFQSLEECKNRCEASLNNTSTQPVPDHFVPVTPPPPKRKVTLVYVGPTWCLAQPDGGLCNANITRFYFDSGTTKCLPFRYTGCGGNDNNFTSRKSCRRACRKGFIKKLIKGQLKKPKNHFLQAGYHYNI